MAYFVTGITERVKGEKRQRKQTEFLKLAAPGTQDREPVFEEVCTDSGPRCQSTAHCVFMCACVYVCVCACESLSGPWHRAG